MWYKILLDVISKPFHAFTSLKEKYEEDEFYKYPWLLLLLIYTVIMVPFSFSLIPTMKQYAPAYAHYIVEHKGLNIDESFILRKLIQQISISPALTPVNIILGFLLAALLLYIYLYFFNYKLKYKQLLTIVSLSYITQVIGHAISILFHHLTQFKFITSFADFNKSMLGLQFLFDSHKNPQLSTFLSLNNFFAIWYLVLLIVGISIVSKKKIDKTTLIVIIPWLIFCGVVAILSK